MELVGALVVEVAKVVVLEVVLEAEVEQVVV